METISPTNPKCTVHVAGLDDAITEDVLRAAFIPFGDIASIQLPLDPMARAFTRLRRHL